MDEAHALEVKKVAIIGAGAAGIATAKYMLAEKKFEDIDIFEQRESLGGVWNYTADTVDWLPSVPLTDPLEPLEEPKWRTDGSAKHPIFISAMYDKLETNIPQSLMQFSDFPFPSDLQLFPPHESVLQYIQDYGAEVLELVQFGTQVTDVELLSSGERSSWIVRTKNLISHCVSVKKYDAVVIASGHYNVPYVPDIRGISLWNEVYPRSISHSKFFRSSHRFANKKVVVVGKSASGFDIGSQISRICRRPLLVSQKGIDGIILDQYEEDVPEIVEFIVERRALRFANGRLEEEIDAVVFCTGYLYSYPFLSSMEPPLISDGARTQHVYKQIFYNRHPTLAFVGLPQKIIPFPLFESQAAVIARVWADRLQLPCLEEMKAWEQETIRERGDGKSFHVLGFPLDADYINEMHEWSLQAQPNGMGKTPPLSGERERWIRERIPLIKRAFVEKGDERFKITKIENLGFIYGLPNGSGASQESVSETLDFWGGRHIYAEDCTVGKEIE